MRSLVYLVPCLLAPQTYGKQAGHRSKTFVFGTLPLHARGPRGMSASAIIVQLVAIRKLASEAADNGLLAPELAAGIVRTPGARSEGQGRELERAENQHPVPTAQHSGDLSLSRSVSSSTPIRHHTRTSLVPAMPG